MANAETKPDVLKNLPLLIEVTSVILIWLALGPLIPALFDPFNKAKMFYQWHIWPVEFIAVRGIFPVLCISILSLQLISPQGRLVRFLLVLQWMTLPYITYVLGYKNADHKLVLGPQLGMSVFAPILYFVTLTYAGIKTRQGATLTIQPERSSLPRMVLVFSLGSMAYGFFEYNFLRQIKDTYLVTDQNACLHFRNVQFYIPRGTIVSVSNHISGAEFALSMTLLGETRIDDQFRTTPWSLSVREEKRATGSGGKQWNILEYNKERGAPIIDTADTSCVAKFKKMDRDYDTTCYRLAGSLIITSAFRSKDLPDPIKLAESLKHYSEPDNCVVDLNAKFAIRGS